MVNKLEPLKLSFENFNKSLDLAPRMVIELVIKNNNEILLLRREAEPYVGDWHLPGGFLMKNEKILECVRRIAEKEVAIGVKQFKFLGLFENIDGDPRGHILHFVVEININKVSENEKRKYFAKLPEDTIFYQKDFLERLGYQTS